MHWCRIGATELRRLQYGYEGEWIHIRYMDKENNEDVMDRIHDKMKVLETIGKRKRSE